MNVKTLGDKEVCPYCKKSVEDHRYSTQTRIKLWTKPIHVELKRPKGVCRMSRKMLKRALRSRA